MKHTPENPIHHINMGTTVVDETGQSLGDVHRVVINPGNHQVSHIVVRKGFFFSTDKVIPVDYIREANDDQVTVNGDIDPAALPDYVEQHYIVSTSGQPVREAPKGVDPMYWYPPYVVSSQPLGYPPFFMDGPQYSAVEMEKEMAIPEGTVPISAETDVYDAKDEHVGKVDEVLVDEEGRATHMIISSGFLFPNHKRVPTFWIAEVLQSHIRLNVEKNVFQKLPDHESTS
ncbi:MAG: PRC-barrel domain-containing protein [Anaerolineales bacterium]